MRNAFAYSALDRHPNLKRLSESDLEYSSHAKMLLGGLIQIGSAERNLEHNRYSNIIPFDHSLAQCSLGYVNASLVTFPNQVSYVIAAGPMSPEFHGPETRDRFWLTALENRVSVMVGLASFEPGFSGCADYLGGARGGEEVYGDLLVSVQAEERATGAYYTKRLVAVQHRDDLQPTLITHFQFHAWPNYSVARNNVDLARLVHEVDECWRNSANGGPPGGRIMVNCSGGVGRSGTFVAIHQAYLEAQSPSNMKASLEEICFKQVVHLRQARHPWMVEGEEQYNLILPIVKMLLGRV